MHCWNHYRQRNKLGQCNVPQLPAWRLPSYSAGRQNQNRACRISESKRRSGEIVGHSIEESRASQERGCTQRANLKIYRNLKNYRRPGKNRHAGPGWTMLKDYTDPGTPFTSWKKNVALIYKFKGIYSESLCCKLQKKTDENFFKYMNK